MMHSCVISPRMPYLDQTCPGDVAGRVMWNARFSFVPYRSRLPLSVPLRGEESKWLGVARTCERKSLKDGSSLLDVVLDHVPAAENDI